MKEEFRRLEVQTSQLSEAARKQGQVINNVRAAWSTDTDNDMLPRTQVQNQASVTSPMTIGQLHDIEASDIPSPILVPSAFLPSQSPAIPTRSIRARLPSGELIPLSQIPTNVRNIALKMISTYRYKDDHEGRCVKKSSRNAPTFWACGAVQTAACRTCTNAIEPSVCILLKQGAYQVLHWLRNFGWGKVLRMKLSGFSQRRRGAQVIGCQRVSSFPPLSRASVSSRTLRPEVVLKSRTDYFPGISNVISLTV